MKIQNLFTNYRKVYGFIKAKLHRPIKWRFTRLEKIVNKEYLKEDLSQDFLPKSVVEKIMQEPNIRNFCCLRILENKGILKPALYARNLGNSAYYSTEDVKDELLRREMVCWKDAIMYKREFYSKRSKLKRRLVTSRAKHEKIVLVIDGKHWTLGKYNAKLTPKIKRIINEIYKHIEIFDPGNENYVSPIWLSTVGRRINAANVDTFDIIAELMKYKEKQ